MNKIYDIDLLKLYDGIYDKNSLKKWLRLTSIKHEMDFYDMMYNFIQKLKRELDLNNVQLANYLAKNFNVKISPTIIWGWCGGEFYGRKRGVPIQIIRLLDDFHFKLTNKNYNLYKKLYDYADIVISMSSHRLKLVKTINKDLAYLLGIIVGDGSCSNTFVDKNRKYKNYRVHVSSSYKYHINKLVEKFYNVFGAKVSPKYDKKNHIWRIDFKSKYIFTLLTKIFEIPVGKKSKIVFIPTQIKNSSKSIQSCFIKGLIDSDGCIYINKKLVKKLYGIYNYSNLCLNLRVRSKVLVEDSYNLLIQLGYKPRKFSYLGKNFCGNGKVKFYGVLLNKNDSEKYCREIGSMNPHKIKVINQFFSKV